MTTPPVAPRTSPADHGRAGRQQLASRRSPAALGPLRLPGLTAMDAAWYKDLRGELFSLLIAVEDRLGPEQAQWVHHVIDVDEYGLALEDIVAILAGAGAPVTDQERAGMLALVRKMQMTTSYRRSLTAARRPGRSAPPVMMARPTDDDDDGRRPEPGHGRGRLPGSGRTSRLREPGRQNVVVASASSAGDADAGEQGHHLQAERLVVPVDVGPVAWSPADPQVGDIG